MLAIAISQGERHTPSKPKLLTYEDYARLTPPNNGNYELHNGKIVFLPTPSPKHQIISGNLFGLLFLHLRTHKVGRVISAPMDTVFTPHDTLQPDILFISNAQLSIIGKVKIDGAPNFIVEILSRSNTAKEMNYKKRVYEASSVREYWVIHPKKGILTQYENVKK
jgi:Uma2 family endonuclease